MNWQTVALLGCVDGQCHLHLGLANEEKQYNDTEGYHKQQYPWKKISHCALDTSVSRITREQRNRDLDCLFQHC